MPVIFPGVSDYPLGAARGTDSTSSMRPLRSILVYLGIVFLGGALMAPWLYKLAQAAAAASPSFQKLADQPFHRYVNRSLLALAILGLWPFLRSIGVRSWREVGLGAASGIGRQLCAGFAVGFGSLAGVALLALVAGARSLDFDHSMFDLLKHLLSAALTAVCVAVLEEIVFRGALFGALRQAWSWRKALTVSSLIYALLHFFQRPESLSTIDWASGLALLPRMMRGFGELEQLIPGFLSLTLVGVSLGLAYQRTGNLYFSIGLHAGWIFWLKFYGFLTREVAGANTWLWGTHKLIDGWLAFVVLALVLLGLRRRLVSCQQKPSP